MTIWSHVLAFFSAWTLKKAYIARPGNLSSDYKNLHARQIPQKTIWSHVLAFFSAWTLKKAYIARPGNLSSDSKICMQGKFLKKLSFSYQTIPDCIRYIIGVFAITLKNRRTFLIHINTLACVKDEI